MSEENAELTAHLAAAKEEFEAKNQKPVAGPNDDYKNDPKLDENGNPKPEDKTPAPAKDPSEKTEEETSSDITKGFDTKAAKGIEDFVSAAGLDAKAVAKEVTLSGGEVSVEIASALIKAHGEQLGTMIIEKMEGMHKAAKAITQARDAALYDHTHTLFPENEDGGEDY